MLFHVHTLIQQLKCQEVNDMKKYKCPKCGMEYDKPGKCTMDDATLVEA